MHVEWREGCGMEVDLSYLITLKQIYMATVYGMYGGGEIWYGILKNLLKCPLPYDVM